MSDNLYLYLEFLISFVYLADALRNFTSTSFFFIHGKNNSSSSQDTKGVENHVIFFRVCEKYDITTLLAVAHK